MNYGKAIRTLRAAKKMTQRQVARSVGVSAPYIGSVERKKAPPGIKLMDKIAKAMDIPPYAIPLIAAEGPDHAGLTGEVVDQILAVTSKIMMKIGNA